MPRSTLLALAALALFCTELSAQTVYRCGPGGREYSQQPCAKGREVDVADPRSADQQRAGADVAAAQDRLARQLEAERREREAANRGVGPAAIKAAAPPAAISASAPKSGHDKKRIKKRPNKGNKKSKDDPRTTWKASAPKP